MASSQKRPAADPGHSPVSPIHFTVHGEPVPQGSKIIGRHELRTWIREDNRKLEPWRNAVTAAAYEQMDGRAPIAGPVMLEVIFVFPRPKAHYRTGRYARMLKDSVPVFCSKRPDLDKLIRALGDALTGTVLIDDAQIVRLYAVKRYGAPMAHITIREVRQGG